MSDLSPLHRLHREQGQSPWIDNLRRDFLLSGHLEALIARGARGLTSNPTIFQKAIEGSDEYDDQFRRLVRAGCTTEEIYWELVLEDINGALDAFTELYRTSQGSDGFVSVEVDPSLAYDSHGTLLAARKLHQRISRPNAMIKIPATEAGLVAIREMIAEGRNVNVTLIFSLDRYSDVIEAYISGLERLASRSDAELSGVSSVASFFISRVDSEVDARLEQADAMTKARLQGKAALTQARLAYQRFVVAFSSERWRRLAERGARVQRPLWASTSTKNPLYPDTMYVDGLIGPDTVNTLPDATFDAFEDHGMVVRTIDTDLPHTQELWMALTESGIDLASVASKLEQDGVKSFQTSFVDLLAAMEAKKSRVSQR